MKILEKIKKILKPFFAVSMACLLLLSTLGINLDRFYCLCKKEFSYSFFDSDDIRCCNMKSVCGKNSNGCMQHSHQFFKLKIDVENAVFSNFSLEKNIFNPIFESIFIKKVPFETDWTQQIFLFSKKLSRPPPPQYESLSGREKGIFYQIFRC